MYCAITFVVVLLLFPWQGMGALSPAGATFKIGMVRDLFLRHTEQDSFIYYGAQFWTNWVNERGGLYYNNSYHDVEIIQEDTSTPNPNFTSIRIIDAYERMVTEKKVDLIVAPFSTVRTIPTLEVSEKYGMITLCSVIAANLLMGRPNTRAFNSVTASEDVPLPTINLVVAAGAKTFVMVRRPDVAAINTANGALKYLAKVGMTSLAEVWVNVTTADSSELQTQIRRVLIDTFAVVGSADVVFFSALTNDLTAIVTVFNQLEIDVKAAVYLIQNSPYDMVGNSMEEAGKYWITSAYYASGFDHGVSGELGGTNAEFEASFFKQFKFYPRGPDAMAASLLMGYYKAVNLTGSIDPILINHTMKTMGEIKTFARNVKFMPNGTNAGAYNVAIQYGKDGIGRIVTKDNIIYPAPFRTAGTPTSTKGRVRVGLIVAIAVPIGVIVLLIAAAGAWYSRSQRAHVVKAMVVVEEGERRNYKIDYSALELDTAIGAGGFGVVYKGDYRGAEVAIKKLKAQKMTRAQLEEFVKESAVMIGLRHPNILLFMGVCIDPPEMCIVTEFMPRGSLYDVIHNDDIVLPFPLIKSFILDAIKGLQFIHSAGMLHRDLKSPNLLVDRSWNLKIADFGLSATKARTEDDVQISLLWTAPEILKKEPGCYSDKSDAYSMAIIMWELLSRKTPFEGMNAAAIPSFIVSGQRPPLNSNWDSKLTQLITACWGNDPSSRPSMKEARGMADMIYADPSFEVGSTSGLVKYVGKAQPPTGTTVTFVYTTVYNSGKLWEHDPHVMMRSLMLHSSVLRENMIRHEGYEIKTDGESFLIVFSDPVSAANFCLDSQKLLMEVDWADSLLKHPDAAEDRNTDNGLIYRGLVVSMGILNTSVSLERNPKSGRFEYYTNELSKVGALARNAGKGWITMTSDMYTKIMAKPDALKPFYIEEGAVLPYNGTDVATFQMTLKGAHDRDNTPMEYLSAFPESSSTLNFEFPPREEKWSIAYKDLALMERIGAGSFGEVKLGNLRGRKVAVKQVMKQKLTEHDLLEVHAESAILSSLNHPNVLSFVGVCLRLPNLCLVTEFMEKGSLDRIIFNPNTLTWAQKLKMAQDMSQGLKYLHEQGIIHRDVKMSNMLVAHDLTIKIADFGYSRMRAENQTMTQVGTVSYSAPEIFEGLHYTDKADVYSLGILLWELVNNKKAWDKKHGMKIAHEVANGNRPSVSECPTSAPPNLVATFQECWAQAPAKRPTLAAICSKLQ